MVPPPCTRHGTTYFKERRNTRAVRCAANACDGVAAGCAPATGLAYLPGSAAMMMMLGPPALARPWAARCVGVVEHLLWQRMAAASAAAWIQHKNIPRTCRAGSCDGWRTLLYYARCTRHRMARDFGEWRASTPTRHQELGAPTSLHHHQSGAPFVR